MKKTIVLTAFFILAAAHNVMAQASFVPFESTRNSLQEIKADETGRTGLIAAALRGNVRDFALYSLGEPVYVSLVEADRIDKQVGASAAAPGSTTLVSHGSIPSILGIAVERGALYQSVSDSLVTFRLNPSGLIRVIQSNSYLKATPSFDGAAVEKAVNRVSGSASFDFNQGSTPGIFTGTRSQLREGTVRIDIVNKRDPRDSSHAGAIRELAKDMGKTVETVQAYSDRLSNMPEFATWREGWVKTLNSKNLQNDTELRAAIFAAADDFKTTFGGDPELSRLATLLVEGVKSYRTVRNGLFERIPKSSALSIEYAFNRMAVPAAALASLPAGTTLPDLSTVRLIYGGPLGSKGEATLNVSTTIFNSTIAGMHGSLRDIQVSGSVDVRLPQFANLGKPVLTFAALGAFLHQQPFGAKVAVNDVETGDGKIASFQSKLTIPTGRSGVRVPLSLTISNRSEFITKEKEIRGAVGITFDMDKLLAQ